ncbi:hypothetical protein EJ06DRAFT_477353 [Trichodelitschia bisporula]|uniref:Uncharacterized protein n=1 Tax=Trichodelitschia bisporula TaxID=703511 RepID=A0A6G1HWQ3_9PEZI|nr:hypothetical protein EJ06DRAFT_477353 [Trichodelitschia bisporula]
MAPNPPPTTLSPQQVHALFDILTQNETFAEIEKFKYPGAIHNYGVPFGLDKGASSTSPILQALLKKFVLELPGLRDVTPDFWRKRCEPLVEKFGAAGLSDSYDKGTIGSRRTLATAAATLIEYPARGCLGGLPRRQSVEGREYDPNEVQDVVDAWDEFLQRLVYGDLIDELFDKTAVSDKLEDHSDLVLAAHEYMLINLASFLHFILIRSPDGPYISRVLENAHKQIPYTLMRQTLRVGNAATMINGMVRLLLTKLSMNSITSWIGLSNPSDEGFNLLQQIIYTLIGWDIKALQKQASALERSKDAPGQDHIESIKNHARSNRDVHDEMRLASQLESKSIVTTILDFRLKNYTLSDPQHAQALEYLSVHLSIRDREQLSEIICLQQPDLITQAIRDLVTAYDPIIRGVHQAVDLSASLTDFEVFLNDLLKISLPGGDGSSGSDSEGDWATVDNFVHLLRTHQHSLHRFLHQVAKNNKQVTQQYREYVKKAVTHFQLPPTTAASKKGSEGDFLAGAGLITEPLQKIFEELSADDRERVLEALDDRIGYLSALFCLSRDSLNTVLEGEGGAAAGPGMYLGKWQQHLDSTVLTPATPRGPVRKGKDVKTQQTEPGVGGRRQLSDQGLPDAPEAGKVVDLLGSRFRELLADWWKKQ